MTSIELSRGPVADLYRELREVRAERDDLAERLQCYLAAAVMLADALERGVMPEEIVAQLRGIGDHIDRTVAGVQTATSPLGVAARGVESDAGGEGSRSAGESAASPPAPTPDSRPRPQRVYEGLVAALDGGA